MGVAIEKHRANRAWPARIISRRPDRAGQQLGGFVEGFAGGIVTLRRARCSRLCRARPSIACGRRKPVRPQKEIRAFQRPMRARAGGLRDGAPQWRACPAKKPARWQSYTGQKRAAQARALCKRHGIDIGIAFAAFLQGCFGERHPPADVVAAGQLGHRTAVFRVHRRFACAIGAPTSRACARKAPRRFHRMKIRFPIPTSAASSCLK